MIVVMKSGATQRQIDHVIEDIEQLGLRSHVIVGTERTVIAALGEKRDGAKQALETGEGVERVVPILAPYKMASSEVKPEPTCVEVLRLKVGNGHLGVIAGPCSVESRDQILEIAHLVKETGAAGLRGGAFKPRTSPYSFQGLLGAVALLAQGGHDGPFGADDDVAAQPQLLDALDDVVDLPLGGVGLHDDDHACPPER